MGRWITPAAFVCALWVSAVRPAVGAAVPFASLADPTVQTLIDLGTDGTIAGDARYFGFSYAGSATAPAADAVRVQPAAGSSAEDGLRFVASWTADDGAAVSSTITYGVAPVDPSARIDAVDLTANGTAPVPAAQTFVTTTAWATPAAGVGPPVLLTTYDDGRTAPVDTTAPDVDAASAAEPVPQPELSVTDTLTAVAGRGGVATASVLQNGFTFAPATVPEPASAALLVGVAAGLCVRRRGGKAK